MALSRRHKAGFGILVIGLISLVVDRALVLPRNAQGDRVDFADAYTMARPDDVSTTVPEAPSERPSVQERLELACSERDLSLEHPRDPLSLPESWREHSSQEASPRGAAATFLRTHKLEGVVVERQGSYVLIDDRLMRVGQELEGFRLIAIGKQSAAFERQGEQVELKLAVDP